MLSDFIYRAPSDLMMKLLVEKGVPCYSYVLNTTVEGLKYPEWRKYTHDVEYFFLSGAPFMDTEFFPKKLRLERDMWTDNDRNMSHFFMKTFTDFARYGNPTPQQVLGLYYEKAGNGELKYLNVNTTYNSTVLMNYRQTENAFWTMVSNICPLKSVGKKTSLISISLVTLLYKTVLRMSSEVYLDFRNLSNKVQFIF